MPESAYSKAGVDIDAGDALVERIKPHAKKTERSGVMGGIGGFGALFDLKGAGFTDPLLVSSTDGVGTKLKVAIESGIHDTVGIDLVAMCVNDLVTSGAEPLFFLDYFATGKLDVDAAATVIAGIAAGCAESGCALIGGETAEMPGMYAAGDYDLAGFSVGAVERDRLITGEHVKAGDVVLGLAASGLHSNGFSLVRHIIKDTGLSYNDPAPFAPGQTLGQALLAPTRLYVKSLLRALKHHGAVKAMANITGGGLLENPQRSVPEGFTVRIDANKWDLPPVFRWLRQQGGLSMDDLARTLNCGIGMVVVTAPEHAGIVADELRAAGETVYVIGGIIPSTGAEVVIEGRDTAWAG
ncbi:MAG: phosphoribosylformylglycinamidine cyclo-ligase [Alphaproteobacteria bacterium]|nr:phosphoribosylformylglycinamidine cyclo-ligase [Alphaproteobacteria bacterium]MBU0859342.1 phosphoribosylformylglycinamidine cyclo-ligase [Alphaproteobacteria bacterium]